MVNDEELECGCCYDILVDPTTLTCGHSFCRYCLAKWFKMSKKTECPECRQNWTGFPNINIHLRTIVEKFFPEKVKARVKSQKNMPEYHDILREFEKCGKKDGSVSQSLSEEQINMITGGIILVAAAILIVVFLGILYWMLIAEAKPREMIFSRTVHKWSAKEVVSWAQLLTGQLGHDYSERFQQAGINGQLLLSLDEDDLGSSPLNVSTALHRKIIIAEIMHLNMTGSRQPRDIWEYKDAHKVSSIYLLFMLQDFPRLTIIYCRFLTYDTVFWPFMETVTGKPQHSEEELSPLLKGWFYILSVLSPYFLFAYYACYFVDVHFYTAWMIILHCIMLTVRESLQIRKVPFRLSTLWSAMFNALVSFVIVTVLYRIVVLFIPGFLLDFCFVIKLYYGPIDTANSIRNGHLQTNAIGKVLNLFFGTINTVIRFIGLAINAVRNR